MKPIKPIDSLNEYLAIKSTAWLESELEQAHALASDQSADPEKREEALAASAAMAGELAIRRRQGS